VRYYTRLCQTTNYLSQKICI